MSFPDFINVVFMLFSREQRFSYGVLYVHAVNNCIMYSYIGSMHSLYVQDGMKGTSKSDLL